MAAVQQFIELTGGDRDVAEAFLAHTQGNVAAAISLFFDQQALGAHGLAAPGVRVAAASIPAVPSALRAPHSPPPPPSNPRRAPAGGYPEHHPRPRKRLQTWSALCG